MVNLLSSFLFFFFIGPSVALRAPSFAPAFCPPDSMKNLPIAVTFLCYRVIKVKITVVKVKITVANVTT